MYLISNHPPRVPPCLRPVTACSRVVHYIDRIVLLQRPRPRLEANAADPRSDHEADPLLPVASFCRGPPEGGLMRGCKI